MTDDVIVILEKAIRDQNFASILAESPLRAAESLNKTLSPEDLELLRAVSFSQIAAIAELWAALRQSEADNGNRSFNTFTSMLNNIERIPNMLEVGRQATWI